MEFSYLYLQKYFINNCKKGVRNAFSLKVSSFYGDSFIELLLIFVVFVLSFR